MESGRSCLISLKTGNTSIHLDEAALGGLPMKAHRISFAILAALLWVLCPGDRAQAQLNTVFNEVFQTILLDQLKLSPGEHKNHYVAAADQAESQLVPALNGLIVSNISSFPLSSTTPGVNFDFSGGQLITVQEGAGPVFADRATTTGKGRLNFGLNATYLDMSRVRGVATDQMRFSFTHEDVNGDGVLGGADAEGSTEADVIDVNMGMNLTAQIFALYGAWGITKNLDIGVAIPFIHIHMSGTANATINSFTYANTGRASHFFGGTADNPILESQVPYDENASGIGDVVLRVKYCFLRGAVDLGVLADVRFPTGKEEDFLGSGATDAILALLMSKKIGDLTPHLNLGYEVRKADFQSDRFIIRAGFDHRLLQGVTFAADFLGTFDLNESEAIKLYPGSVTVVEAGNNGGQVTRSVRLSNIPDRSNDNLYNLSMGVKYSPWQGFLALVNMLVPLNQAGLRASIAPTVGVSLDF
jgi:hypothetical protein